MSFHYLEPTCSCSMPPICPKVGLVVLRTCGLQRASRPLPYSCVPHVSDAGEIIKEMGWVALFTRGLPLRIIMIGTLTGLQWGIYDAFKVFVGL